MRPWRLPSTAQGLGTCSAPMRQQQPCLYQGLPDVSFSRTARPLATALATALVCALQATLCQAPLTAAVPPLPCGALTMPNPMLTTATAASRSCAAPSPFPLRLSIPHMPRCSCSSQAPHPSKCTKIRVRVSVPFGYYRPSIHLAAASPTQCASRQPSQPLAPALIPGRSSAPYLPCCSRCRAVLPPALRAFDAAGLQSTAPKQVCKHDLQSANALP